MPEQAPDTAVCNPHVWNVRRYRVSRWPDLRRRLQIVIRTWRTIQRQERTSPESRLAQMVIEAGRAVDGNWSADPMLLERLEDQITATDDLAVRKVFAAYLSEP